MEKWSTSVEHPDAMDSSGDTDVMRNADRSGKLLSSRYLLIEEIGRGGFAVTWLAKDTQVAGRSVVVKIPLDKRASDSWSLKKFRGEMEALALIDDPGVVGILDFGQLEDGRPFLVMQFVSGRSLRESLPREGMPFDRMANLLQQIGRALTAAHEAGVCHCDLKPENIVVQTTARGEEQAKVIDFGLARIPTAAGSAESSTVSGTWSYMAPEQFDGRSDSASDVYQMGVIAYEMATGIKPFRASTPGGLLLEKGQGLRVQPRDLRADLPETAQVAILQALSQNPENRQRRASDFGDSMAAALAEQEGRGMMRVPLPRGSGVAPRWGWRLAAAVILVILAVVAGAAAYRWRTPPGDDQSVAVLPFQNLLNDPDTAYLSEGVTESLINDLSHIPTLHIRARGAVLRYSGDHIDPLRAGRELHVTRIVMGSVSSWKGELRIEAELIDVRTGTRLWGKVYTRPLSNFADALGEFSTEVTDQLRLKLSGPLKERLARQYVAGSGAYQLYLQARYHLNKRTSSDFDQAVALFEKAIAKNPSYAPAYAGLASAYAVMASFVGDPEPLLEKTRTAAQQAVDLDGTLAESYASLAFVDMQLDYQWTSAENNFLRSIELNPNGPEAREGYALELTAVHRFDEAVRQIEVARDLDPDSLGIPIANVLVLYLARRHTESLNLLLALADRQRRESPGEFIAHDVAEMTAQNYWAQGMPADALRALTPLQQHSNGPDAPLFTIAYARLGQVSKAEELRQHFSPDGHAAAWYDVAAADVSLGRKSSAIRDLEHAHEKHAFEVMYVAVDPMLVPLREEPGFRALLAQMNLTPME